jgi:ribosomal-protein-alanine N-acetyltransferase
LNIRIATPADLPTLIKLERQSHTAAHWSEETYQRLFAQQHIATRVVIAAENDADVIGFAVARNVGPEWEIENIIVAAPKRRHGVGSALVSEIVNRAEAANGESVSLEVRQSNLAARALYKKSGFAECGYRKAYYSDPEEDAVCYRLILASKTQNDTEGG